MGVSVGDQGTHVLLTVDENVTFENAAAFKSALEGALAAGASKNLVVDLEGVNYICSSALGSLIYLFRHVGQEGGTVYVVTPHTKIRRVFDLVHIPRLVTFVNDRATAVEQMHPAGSDAG